MSSARQARRPARHPTTPQSLNDWSKQTSPRRLVESRIGATPIMLGGVRIGSFLMANKCLIFVWLPFVYRGGHLVET